MDLLLWILFGAITAWISAIVLGIDTPTRSRLFIVAGTLGAVVAGYVMQLLTGRIENSLNYYSLLVSVGGSMLIVGICVARIRHKL